MSIAVPRRSRTNGLLTPVDFDFPVNAAYWQAGRQVTPQVAMARSGRLEHYQRLLRGIPDLPGLEGITDPLVYSNYFGRSARTYAALLMAFPPAFEGLPEDFDLDGFLAAIRECIVSMISNGTALLYADPDSGDVLAPDVRDWFPTDDYAGDVIREVNTPSSEDGETPDKSVATVWRLVPGNAAELTFQVDGDKFSTQLNEKALNLTERTVFPIQLPESERRSEWGSSMFEPLVPLVTQITRRYTQLGNVLDDFGDPVITAEEDPGAGPAFPYGDDAQAQESSVVTRRSLKAQRRDGVLIVGRILKNAAYLTYDADNAAAFQMIGEVEDQVYAETGLAAALYGVIRGEGVASGETLKRMFTHAYVRIDQIQHAILTAALDALDMAGYPDVRPTWINALDAVDTVTVDQGGTTPEQDAIMTGGNL